MNNWYDNIGKGYTNLRIPDNRIGEIINSALGESETIANIGAGSGSYEPADKTVYAIEPSSLMLKQYSGKGIKIQGIAELLPFANNTVDASMGILTMHHWQDWQQGLSEMLRVSSDVAILLTHEPDLDDFWLLDYFPKIKEIDQNIFPKISAINNEIAKHQWQLRNITVPIPYDCSDGFLGAYWRRPDAYFNADVRRSISTFNLLDDDLVTAALTRLREDLDSGRWNENYGEISHLPELDIGYRILLMTPVS